MNVRLCFVLLLSSCAGPKAHQVTVAGSALVASLVDSPRAEVASMLTAADPLDEPHCALPATPWVSCTPPGAEPTHDEVYPPHRHEPPHQPKAQAPPRFGEKVNDPVCGMEIDPTTAKGGSLEFEGAQFFFCSAACRRTFLTQHPGAK